MRKRKYRDRAKSNKRMTYAVGALVVLFAILSIRLSYIMIGKRNEYGKMAEEQWTSEVKIDARRGRILDRHGTELAVSANVYRIDFDLNSIRAYLSKENKTTADIAPLIADAAGMKTKDVKKKLETKLPSGKNAGSATLIRRIEKEEADKVKALGIHGVIVSPDTKRYYPNGSFLSHVLGSTNIDGQGLTGIELQYNKYLSGVPGMKISEIDSKSSDLPYTISKFTPPVDGKDVVLTVDENLQFFAEKAATQALKDNKAKAVSVMIMNPKNGEILAMANKPDFDPNKPYEGSDKFTGKTDGEKLQKMWRNRLVNDTFEPGSIFKTITAIAALEEGLVTKDTKFNCGGAKTVGGRTLHCWKTDGHGTLTFPEIIEKSCNVGFMDLGEKLGKEKLNEYIYKFGFGKVSGVDLPGEAKGIVKRTESISATDLATISFGQTNTVNSVQFMTAFNALANGGTLIQPHIMKEVTHKDEDGTVIIDESFSSTKKVVASKEKTEELRKYLEQVVIKGSAKGAFTQGYRIGGKTGTAQKVNPETGRYEKGKYVSSFVGMAPIDDPQITVMVTIDEPSNGAYYAGQVTSPVAKILFADIFNYMENEFGGLNEASILRDVVVPEVRGLKIADAKKELANAHLDYEIEGSGEYVVSVSPYPGYSVKSNAKIKLYTGTSGTYNKDVIMPDIRGYSKSEAMNLLDSLGIKYEIIGEGAVYDQNVPQGELIKKGETVVKLTLNNDYKD